MSAQQIYDNAPLGSIIRYSDDTPRPPERFRKKLSAWESRNASGRLIGRQPARAVGNCPLPASIKLHKGDFASGGVILMVIHQSFSVDTQLRFEVIETPPIGSVRVLATSCGEHELLHLAADRAGAEAWLRTHRYPNAILQDVTADEVAADFVEGRAA